MAYRMIGFVLIGALMAMAPLCQAAALHRPGDSSDVPASIERGAQADGPRLRLASASRPAFLPLARAIREAQGLLKALGYRPGPADGLWGPRTANAYAAFLRDAGLAPREALTPDALRAMREKAGKGTKARSASNADAPAVPMAKDRREAKAAGPARTARGELPGCDAWGTPDFFKAATPDRVTECLRAGADPNARGDFGYPPLHMAVWLNKDPAVVALLLEAGADVTAKLKRGELALDLAVTTNPDAASLLLKALAKSGLWKEHGITPLHEAALFARASDVSSLLKGGADPNARYWDGSGPLHWSVYLRSAQPDKTLAVVAALMEAGADPRASNNYGYTPLHRAASNGNPALVAALVKAGADPNARDKNGGTPLHSSEWIKNPNVVAALLKAGADPKAVNKYGSTPLFSAARNKNPAVAAALVKAGADPKAVNKYGSTPLFSAARNKNPAVAAALVKAGADPKARNKKGDTPLHAASSNGNPAVVANLIKAGADPRASEKSGWTPLHSAARNRNLAVAAALLNAGADPNAKTKHAITPLHSAASNKNPAIVAVLIEAGADPHARRDSGWTPLHSAALRKNPAVVAALLKGGADPNARGGGRTPLDLALQRGYRAVAELLRKAGATARATSRTAAPKHTERASNRPLAADRGKPGDESRRQVAALEKKQQSPAAERAARNLPSPDECVKYERVKGRTIGRSIDAEYLIMTNKCPEPVVIYSTAIQGRKQQDRRIYKFPSHPDKLLQKHDIMQPGKWRDTWAAATMAKYRPVKFPKWWACAEYFPMSLHKSAGYASCKESKKPRYYWQCPHHKTGWIWTFSQCR